MEYIEEQRISNNWAYVVKGKDQSGNAVAIKRITKINTGMMVEYGLLSIIDHKYIIKPITKMNVGDPGFVLPWADITLDVLISKNMSYNKKLIIKQLVAAVHYLHSNGILHQDIKPQNVVINKTAKLIDFGLARYVGYVADDGNNLYSYLEMIQSGKYRAPEVSAHRSYSSKIDIYSIGRMCEVMEIEPPMENMTHNNYLCRPSISDLHGTPLDRNSPLTRQKHIQKQSRKYIDWIIQMCDIYDLSEMTCMSSIVGYCCDNTKNPAYYLYIYNCMYDKAVISKKELRARANNVGISVASLCKEIDPPIDLFPITPMSFGVLSEMEIYMCYYYIMCKADIFPSTLYDIVKSTPTYSPKKIKGTYLSRKIRNVRISL